MAFNITKVINGRGPQQLSFSFVLGANGAKPVKAGRAEQANICDKWLKKYENRTSCILL
jgi:hypothetical protein